MFWAVCRKTMRGEPGGSEEQEDGQCPWKGRGEEADRVRDKAGGGCPVAGAPALGGCSVSSYKKNDIYWARGSCGDSGSCLPAWGSPLPCTITSKAWRGGEGARTIGGYLTTCMPSPGPPSSLVCGHCSPHVTGEDVGSQGETAIWLWPHSW